MCNGARNKSDRTTGGEWYLVKRMDTKERRRGEESVHVFVVSRGIGGGGRKEC